MVDLGAAFLVYSTQEIVAFVVFIFLRKKFEGQYFGSAVSILKGMLERLVLLTGLVIDVTQVFILFGALKIGTRLAESNKSKISNDYFLVGNLTSVLIVLVFYGLYKHFKL